MTPRTNQLTAVSILSLSLLTMAPGAVAATVPGILQSFPGTTQSVAESTITATSFTMALFIIISSFLVKKWGTRKIVLTGLALVAISTLLAVFATNITVLFYSRIILGTGIGLFNALCVSLIGYFYNGREREKLLGYQNTFQGLGAAGGSLIVTVLLMVANWRMAYLIYFVSIIIFVLYFLFVPEVQYGTPAQEMTEQETPKHRLQAKDIASFSYYWLILFIMMIFYVTVTVKITTYVLENHFGSLSTGSSAVVIMSLGTIVAGTLYGRIYHRLQKNTLLLAIVIELLGALLLATAQSALACMIGALVVGVSFGFFIPFIFSIGLSFVPKKYGNDATTVMMMSTNAATFSCPYIDKLMMGTGSNRLLFTIFIFLFTCIGIIELGKHILTHHSHLA